MQQNELGNSEETRLALPHALDPTLYAFLQKGWGLAKRLQNGPYYDQLFL